jgi:hypothetical protein
MADARDAAKKKKADAKKAPPRLLRPRLERNEGLTERSSDPNEHPRSLDSYEQAGRGFFFGRCSTVNGLHDRGFFPVNAGKSGCGSGCSRLATRSAGRANVRLGRAQTARRQLQCERMRRDGELLVRELGGQYERRAAEPILV